MECGKAHFAALPCLWRSCTQGPRRGEGVMLLHSQCELVKGAKLTRRVSTFPASSSGLPSPRRVSTLWLPCIGFLSILLSTNFYCHFFRNGRRAYHFMKARKTFPVPCRSPVLGRCIEDRGSSLYRRHVLNWTKRNGERRHQQVLGLDFKG